MIKNLLPLVFALLSFNAISQKFKLPDIPKYDSIYVDSYNGVIHEKSYFLKGKKVFEKGYNTGSVLYTPFSHIGGGKEDSCYAYFNGKDNEVYDFYYISRSYIKNEKYSETSKIMKYKMFDWNNIPIEQGKYYFIKKMYARTITHCDKYKIGIWLKYDTKGNPVETVDYDNLVINGKKIELKDKKSVINLTKVLSDKKIIEVYGKTFFSNYVRFNLDQSGYYTYKDPRPEQPGGKSILDQTADDIHFVDLSYDIIIGDERFNAIQFRLSNDGHFLGRTYFSDFARYFYLTQGLDSLNNRKFHENVLNWKKIAATKGFDITSKSFNVRFDFKPTSDYYGELRLVLEQIINSTSTKSSFINKNKQLYINPWTGEIIEKLDTQGLVMESTEGAVNEGSEEEEEEVFTVVEQSAQFPDMMNYIEKNLKYPKDAKEKGIEGKVIIGFEVDKEGKLDKIRVLKGLDKNCDEEAIRIIKMMPNWIPAKMNGRIVRSKMTIPIKFKNSK